MYFEICQDLYYKNFAIVYLEDAMSWYAKMYFSGDREIFQYDSMGTQGAPAVQQELPFLESLLSFQELDIAEQTPLLKDIADCWSRYIADDDKDALVSAMMKLGELGARHIYFHLLYVHFYERMSRLAFSEDRGSAEDKQMLDELRRLPEILPVYQKQVQRFFDLVLDVDTAGREPQVQASKNYYYDIPNDPDLFRFHPIPLSFEPVEYQKCSPVLYSGSIADMIDYSLRSCVERGITVRRCKNCGRYFPQTGRVSAEYCERPVPSGQTRCREIGALKQWTIRQSEDPVFKAYRKEYKRRFAWIKAGRITDKQFYDWSEQAREQKKKCDRDIISAEEFYAWLKASE